MPRADRLRRKQLVKAARLRLKKGDPPPEDWQPRQNRAAHRGVTRIPLPPSDEPVGAVPWPDDQPVPEGVILTHPRQLVYPSGYWEPPVYYFVDTDGVCIDCGQTFFFSADEQQFWYRRVKIPVKEPARRCLECRRRKRAVPGTQRRVGQARRAFKQAPDDLEARLEVSRSLLALQAVSGKGDLDEAVGHARAVRLARGANRPLMHEAYLLEARAETLRGRAERSRDLLGELLEQADVADELAEQAVKTLAELKDE